MESSTNILTPMLFDAAIAFAFVAAFIGFVCGVWLLIAPSTFNLLEKKSETSISLRRGLKPFEIVRNIDRHIYRHHSVFGLLIIAASIYTLYRVLFDVSDGKIEILLHQFTSPVVGEWIFRSLELLLIIGHIFTIIIGLVIYVRPSALKSLEAQANKWVSVRQKTRWLDTHYDLPDRLLQAYPKQLGFIILLLSIYLSSILVVI